MDEKKINRILDDFNRRIKQEPFIENPHEYVKRYVESNCIIQNEQLLMSFYAIIMFHNGDLLVKLENENKKLQAIIDMETKTSCNTPIVNEENKATTYQVISSSTEVEQKNVDQFLEVIDVFDNVEEIIEYMENIALNDIPYIKLQLLKRIVELRKKIYDLLNDKEKTIEINTLKQKLEKYVLLIKGLTKKEKTESVEEVEEEFSGYVGQNQRLVFVGNDENNAYLYDDILNRRDGKYKELMSTITKLLNGSFLKNTKQIHGYKGKLFEYYNSNGIRIIYVVEKNIIAICSFFEKDKTKSIKITKFYDEAISRYEKRKQYIMENLETPNFWNEQQEYIGQIYGLFEDKGLTLKRGDYID